MATQAFKNEGRWKGSNLAVKRLTLTLANATTGAPASYLEDDGSGNPKLFNSAGTGVSLSAAELALLDGLIGSIPQVQMVSLTETTGAGTYTGSITVPAGALILDIKAWSTVLWTATTSATLKVGDATDDDGWFTGVNLKATDLLVGEELNFIQTGGKEGAYLSLTTGLRSAAYSAAARVVSFIVTTVGAAGSAGRTFGAVVYIVPVASAAAKA
jgi:hypothetical protein